jgi:diacylglycerol kinase (ATP)
MSASYATVIVNPMAGGRTARREWPKINAQLQKVGLSFEFEFTHGIGHAVEIATQAINRGRQFLIAVGGDGTVNEVVNGMLQSGKAADLTLGIIPAGTAHAFSYSLGIGKDYAHTCSCLVGKRKIQIDLGFVKCWSQGHAVERFFVNEASIGLSAEIVDAWGFLPTGPGRSTNLPFRKFAGYKALASHRNKAVKLRMGNDVESIRICAVFIANGQYCADKMLIAPNASLNDGLLDSIIVGDVSKSELMKIRPTLYDGSHIRHDKIRVAKVTGIMIESDESLLVEADGDVIGESPVSFRVIPSALTVMV